jgi:hypothetical protein
VFSTQPVSQRSLMISHFWLYFDMVGFSAL